MVYSAEERSHCCCIFHFLSQDDTGGDYGEVLLALIGERAAPAPSAEEIEEAQAEPEIEEVEEEILPVSKHYSDGTLTSLHLKWPTADYVQQLVQIDNKINIKAQYCWISDLTIPLFTVNSKIRPWNLLSLSTPRKIVKSWRRRWKDLVSSIDLYRWVSARKM